MEKPAYCGHEAHEHTKACYEMQLVCGVEELSASAETVEVEEAEEAEQAQEAHVHSADC